METRKNYITPQGYEKLLTEYNHLLKTERPQIISLIQWAASNGDRSENADYLYGKKRLREIDRRLRFLDSRINSALVIDPCSIQSQKVQFGATVQIRDENELIRHYSIVGIDEVDTKKGHISWQSPIGKNLIGKNPGDEVLIQAPGGEMVFEIVLVKYQVIE